MLGPTFHKNSNYKCAKTLHQQHSLGEPLMLVKMEPVELAHPKKPYSINIITNEEKKKPDILDEAKETECYFVPSKVRLRGSLVKTPETFGVTSFLMTESAKESLAKVKDVLVRNGTDIFHFDERNFILKGLLLIKNKPISLRVTVWNEGTALKKSSRIEIKRMQGSPLLFNMVFEFLRKNLLAEAEFDLHTYEQFGQTEKSLAISPFESIGYYCDCDCDYGFGSDFESSSGLGSGSECRYYGDCYDEEQLQMYAEDINNDEYQLETLSLVLNCIPRKKIIEHDVLVKAIRTCLTSTDLAVQKVAERILTLK